MARRVIDSGCAAAAAWIAVFAGIAGFSGLSGCTPKADTGWAGYAEGEYIYLAAPVAGRLLALPAARGSTIAAGSIAFRLDAALESAERAEAAARLDVARAQAADTDKGRRPEEQAVTSAQAAQARAQAALAEAELARQQRLLEQGFVAQARVDEAASALRVARARVDELSATLQVGRLPARSDARAAARATAAATAQAFAQARWREQQAAPTAPVAARVGETYFRIGEWVAAGQPVLALLPAGATKARFYVPEAERASLAIGQPVALRCTGCGVPLKARIDFIATEAEYTPPVIYSNAQRARLMFRVEARPDAADAARLSPGQPLDVSRAAP